MLKNKLLRMVKLLFILAFLSAPSLTHAQTYEGNKADIDQILENIKAFSNYYMNLDYDGIANAYAKNAKILPPGAGIIEGREAIKKRWMLPEGVRIPLHKITPVEIKIIDDHAYDVGYYEGRTKRKDGSEISWKGKYVIVWKKEAGDWKIYLDAWNKIEV